MLLHAFPSMSVSSLREFPENCVYRHAIGKPRVSPLMMKVRNQPKLRRVQTRRIQLFIKIFAQKIINYQCISYDIESAEKTFIYWICILKQ
jgi:hypothetical protein